MAIILGTDHAGYELKEEIKAFLNDAGYEVEDVGAFEYDEGDDYPDYVIPAAEKASEEGNLGIVFGGSGQGEAIAANKVKGVRCAVFYGPKKSTGSIDAEGDESGDPYEMLRLEKKHNNANVLSLAARFLDTDTAKEAVKTWLEANFNGVERHERRISKISNYETR